MDKCEFCESYQDLEDLEKCRIDCAIMYYGKYLCRACIIDAENIEEEYEELSYKGFINDLLQDEI